MPEQLVLHGQLADALHGGVESSLDRVATSALEAFVHGAQRLIAPLLEPVDLDADLPGDSVQRLAAQQAKHHLTLSAGAPAFVGFVTLRTKARTYGRIWW